MTPSRPHVSWKGSDILWTEPGAPPHVPCPKIIPGDASSLSREASPATAQPWDRLLKQTEQRKGLFLTDITDGSHRELTMPAPEAPEGSTGDHGGRTLRLCPIHSPVFQLSIRTLLSAAINS